MLDDVVDIALDYLEATGQARIGDDTQYLVASAVLSSWLAGKRHRIRLANDAILAVERAQAALAKARRPSEVHLDALRDLAMPSGPMWGPIPDDFHNALPIALRYFSRSGISDT